MEDLMQESMFAAQEEFYSKKFYFSYSSLNKLLWNPMVFYQMYVMGIKEESASPSLTAGKVIHALLLSEDVFKEQYIISPESIPSGNTKLVVDRVFAHHKELAKNGDVRTELMDYSDAILDVLQDINLHQNLKTDLQRIDKIVSSETLSYWQFLRSSGNKQIIDVNTYNYCLEATEVIKENPQLNKLMGLDSSVFDAVEVFNEVEFQKDMDKYPFGLKGIVDNLVVNHDEKMIYINDLKTTSKELKDFSESIEYYSYWMQAAVYTILVYLNYGYLIDQGYQVKFHFVVIDKNFMTYAFPVSQETQEKWVDRFHEVIEIAKYHYTNRKFGLPYKFCTNQVIL